MTSRRRLLASAGALLGALAGCVTRGPGPREAPDPWRRRETIDGDGRQGVRGVVSLRRGEFAAVPFGRGDDTRSLTIELRVRERLGLPVDLLTFDRPDFADYRAGKEPDPISLASASDVKRIDFSRLLPPGDYVLVVDNSGFGPARPLDEVTVDLEFGVTV